MLSRKQTANLLGFSEETLRTREKKGWCRPCGVNHRGWSYYTEAYVEKLQEKLLSEERYSKAYLKKEAPLRQIESRSLKAKYDPKTAAQIFNRLREGKTCADIVIELTAHPDIVKAVHEEWIRLKALDGGVLLLTQADLDALHALPLPGSWPITTAKELLDNLREVSEGTQLCRSCGKTTAICCMSCAVGAQPKKKGR